MSATQGQVAAAFVGEAVARLCQASLVTHSAAAQGPKAAPSVKSVGAAPRAHVDPRGPRLVVKMAPSISALAKLATALEYQ